MAGKPGRALLKAILPATAGAARLNLTDAEGVSRWRLLAVFPAFASCAVFAGRSSRCRRSRKQAVPEGSLHLRQQLLQSGEVRRFRQVVLETSFFRAAAIFFLTYAGDSDKN